ncbi:GNAT family N-acetyltransferase [Plebeiibacterium sediminum]|uniref:GNAT family N-acetyltransferase n=1 Tax=Plebeiibacterium sediminum TaxID=2992112 RepID=A0AAE3M5A0_9BACT|nr:GNAT family N-acetyltransferase [Plebeiobacterium sediminum]MCW3787085.1 GNAT family N-acetyltransferase [Plebeiobacterium sediminum]
MNNTIVNNLFDFWKHIGFLTGRLIVTKEYTAVSMHGSDWPNRIFDIETNPLLIEEVSHLSKANQLPDMITISNPDDFIDRDDFEFRFAQRNMALDMNLLAEDEIINTNITRVETETDAINFANTASNAFGYKVDADVVSIIATQSDNSKLFIYKEGDECLGCGIVYFDANNNAGLHMIGTVDKGRGKGIGKSMTEWLLCVARQNKSPYCVLNASVMGEPIYTKLGFRSYGDLRNYQIIED